MSKGAANDTLESTSTLDIRYSIFCGSVAEALGSQTRYGKVLKKNEMEPLTREPLNP